MAAGRLSLKKISAPGDREFGELLTGLDGNRETNGHIFRAGNLQSFPKEPDNREAHDAVLPLKTPITHGGGAGAKKHVLVEIGSNQSGISGMEKLGKYAQALR